MIGDTIKKELIGRESINSSLNLEESSTKSSLDI